MRVFPRMVKGGVESVMGGRGYDHHLREERRCSGQVGGAGVVSGWEAREGRA